MGRVRTPLMGSTPPYYRAVVEQLDAKAQSEIGQEQIVRDRRGVPRAMLERGRLRGSFYCGEQSGYAAFETMASASARALLDIPREVSDKLPSPLGELCRLRPPVSKYVFGKVSSSYPPVTNGWFATVFQEDDGVVIYVPEVPVEQNSESWMLQVYRIAWSGRAGQILRSKKTCWRGNTTFPYEYRHVSFGLEEGEQGQPTIGDYFYSTLGDDDAPLDINSASAIAIRKLIDLCDADHRSPPTASKGEVFISYSHRDKRYLDQLSNHLSVLERYAEVKVWSDEKLQPSDEWRSELFAAMERASVAVILISANYLASDFCADVELVRFLEARKKRGLRVVGVLLSECLYQETPLANVQLMPHDKNNNLRAVCDFSSRERAWTDVARKVLSAVRGDARNQV